MLAVMHAKGAERRPAGRGRVWDKGPGAHSVEAAVGDSPWAESEKVVKGDNPDTSRCSSLVAGAA